MFHRSSICSTRSRHFALEKGVTGQRSDRFLEQFNDAEFERAQHEYTNMDYGGKLIFHGVEYKKASKKHEELHFASKPEKQRIAGEKRKEVKQESQDPTEMFGNTPVPQGEKKKRVGDVFSSVAHKYDIMNDLMSGGLHRYWKYEFVKKLNPKKGMNCLDVAGGTGDISFRIIESLEEQHLPPAYRLLEKSMLDGGITSVTCCDINPDMLEEAKRRANSSKNLSRYVDNPDSLIKLDFAVADAEKLPFEDNMFDTYTISFGIRNVTQIDKALSEAYRVLKPGGRFLCLEFSHIADAELLKKVYDIYSEQLIPTMGDIVANDRDSYQYLVESIRRFPTQEKFAGMIETAGFSNVGYENYTQGIVAIHSGYKFEL